LLARFCSRGRANLAHPGQIFLETRLEAAFRRSVIFLADEFLRQEVLIVDRTFVVMRIAIVLPVPIRFIIGVGAFANEEATGSAPLAVTSSRACSIARYDAFDLGALAR